MPETGSRPSVQLATLLGVAIVVLATGTPIGGTGVVGTAAANDGIHYVTDSGFEVIDASGGDPPKSGNPFPDGDDETLELPDITLSASGGAVTVDQRTGTNTKLSSISGLGSADITANPDDKQAVVVKSGIDSLDFASADYDASNSGTDITYDAGSSASLTVKGTGLSQGTTVDAIDTSSGNTLDSADVAASGTVTFTSLPTGTHDVDLEDPSTASSGGSGSTTEADTTPPIADAGGDRTVTAGEELTFDASGSSDNDAISHYKWYLTEDSGYRTGEAVTGSYDTPGEYTVTLEVTDESSNTDTDTLTVTVTKTSPNNESDESEQATEEAAGPVITGDKTDDGTVEFDVSASETDEVVVLDLQGKSSDGQDGADTGSTENGTDDTSGDGAETDGGENNTTERNESDAEDASGEDGKSDQGDQGDEGSQTTENGGAGTNAGGDLKNVAVDSLDIRPTETGDRSFRVTVREWGVGTDTEATQDSTDTDPGSVEAQSPTDATASGPQAERIDPRDFLEDSEASPAGSLAVRSSETSDRSSHEIAQEVKRRSDEHISQHRSGTDTGTVAAQSTIDDTAGETQVQRSDPREFLEDTGASPVGYVEVNHTNPNSDIQNVTFQFRVRKDYLNRTDVGPESVGLYRDESTGWNDLTAEKVGENATHHVFESTSPGLSLFTIGSTRPVFEVTQRTVQSTEVTTGEEVTVEATVRNLGGSDGTHTVNVTANGDVLTTKDVEVDAKSATELSLSFVPDSPGSYNLSVNGQLIDDGMVSVSESSSAQSETQQAGQSDSEPTTTSDSTTQAGDTTGKSPGTDPGEGTSGGLWPAAIAVLLVGGLLVLVVYRNRDEEESDSEADAEPDDEKE